jgi:hypothetical protein
VDTPVNISHGVVDHLMLKFIKAVVGLQRDTVKRRTGLDMLSDFGLKRFLAAIRNYRGADLAILSVFTRSRIAHYGGLVLAASSGDPNCPRACVHVASFAADKSFVRFDMAREFLETTFGHARRIR